MPSLALFTTQTTDATSSTLQWFGGTGNVRAAGTFDSATADLQYSVDGAATWQAVASDSTFTTAGNCNFTLPPCDVRCVISGGGGSLSLTVAVVQ
jgi:uncharacterized protein YaiE (UPF0345 family)